MLSHHPPRLLGVTAVAVLFLAALTAAPAFAGETPQAAQPAVGAPSPVSASCDPGLNLTGKTAKAEICPAAQPESLLPEILAKPPRHGYCICGCGATCTTDADCGGSACVAFITCC